MITKSESLKVLQSIPGVGKSIAEDLYDIGIRQVTDLKGCSPEELYDQCGGGCKIAACSTPFAVPSIMRKRHLNCKSPKN